jgi:mycothiol synthase
MRERLATTGGPETVRGTRSDQRAVRKTGPMSASDVSSPHPAAPSRLPEGWSAWRPVETDAFELADLLRRHEERARGWASSSQEDVLVHVSERGYLTRDNVVLRDDEGVIRGWGSAHDRAAGRMLLAVVVDPGLARQPADLVAAALLSWADDVGLRFGGERGLAVQQVDTGAFADDERQQRWLSGHGFEHVRTWWQMSRPVDSHDAARDIGTHEAVRIRPVGRTGAGLPDQDDLRCVHDILESAFADHFNSHEESFDEFVFRLREDPGHRWDHWWIAELLEDDEPTPVGALVGSVIDSADDGAQGTYVEYIGVLAKARGRGVAKSLLNTVIADAASRGRDRVGLEVDASSPTGAQGLYLSMGWETSYVTQSWHREVDCGPDDPHVGG